MEHSLGGQLRYQSDAKGRIAGFTDPEGNAYQYTWDGDGRLIAVTYPGGESRTYHYEHSIYPNALTGITDENGERFATWWYDNDGRANLSEHAGGAERVTIDYTYLDHATDPQVLVTSALGRQSTYHVTTLHGVRKVTEVEGHPTDDCAGANKAYSYDANGFLASKTDWNGNLTTYVHNARGLQTSRTEACGTPQERTITTQWHADYRVPIRITAPRKLIELSYDAQGRLLTRTERAAP
jgi:YD repeat-containing protein